ncbi:MAG: OstA-like protein [Bacteroidia bacterium]
MKIKTSIIYLCWLCLVPEFVFAQGSEKIQLLHANSLEYDLKTTGKVKRLIGDVKFKQQQTVLTCDSAYQYDDANRIEAFGNVRINHQDSIRLFGDQLNYDGNTRMARLTGKVIMIDDDMTLTSNALDYDMKTNMGYYSDGGKIVSGKNTLTSKYGFYYSGIKEAFFKTNVVLVNPEYTIVTDTLRYRTVSKLTFFHGPTSIKGNTDKLLCNWGVYDTERQIAQFGRGAALKSNSNLLFADSLYYERKTEFGKAFRNIELHDTVNHVIVYGDYGELYGKTKRSIVTTNAVAKQSMENDSFFLFADTIQSFQWGKNNTQFIQAFRHVRIYKSDMQSVCDSLTYNRGDSLIVLYSKPILWSGPNQITADTILLFMQNNKPDSFICNTNAFIVSREAARLFNQVKGKNLYGSFYQNKIRYVFVSGNAQSIYYAKEDSDYIGVNVIDCSEMEFYFDQNRMQRANFINMPEAVLYPMNQRKPEELRLKGFNWHNRLRPSQTLIYKRFSTKSDFLKKTLWDTLIYQ